jgi:hypothetical protein
LKEDGGNLDMIKELPNLGPGEFQMVSPDVSRKAIPIQCRWLYTEHGAPFSEDQVEKNTTNALRNWAKDNSAKSSKKTDLHASAATAAASVNTRSSGMINGRSICNQRWKGFSLCYARYNKCDGNLRSSMVNDSIRHTMERW